ncbi:Phage terminase small subunit [Pediococcus damnosus]|nr:Phage terminase small subunit [Pediococcus damnosus]AMV64368.1 Phage terminase small subunit [Pediococcus damnosus]
MENLPVSALDRTAIEMYVRAYATYITAMNAIRKDGLVKDGRKNPYFTIAEESTKTIRAIGNDLGLTISSRQRLELNKAKTDKPSDPFEALLNGG